MADKQKKKKNKNNNGNIADSKEMAKEVAAQISRNKMAESNNKMADKVPRLAAREATAFKRLMKCYEERQFKQGLKFAKQILGNPKSSDHPETWAVRGLLLLGLGKVVEAEDSVRTGLKNNPRSVHCWHSLGLVLRQQDKFPEAVKSFRNALRIDPENLEVLRDLAILQVHTRELEAFCHTRLAILLLKPTQRGSWAGLALSYHLLGDSGTALWLLKQFRSSQANVPRNLVGQVMQALNKRAAGNYDYEHSELLKYENRLMRETDDPAGALEHLEEHAASICDQNAVQETRLQLCLELHRLGEAEATALELLRRNPHNAEYFRWLERIAQATGQHVGLYKRLRDQLPSSDTLALRSLSATATSGDSQLFCEEITAYLRSKLVGDCPGLFSSIKGLYNISGEVAAIVGAAANVVLGEQQNIDSGSCALIGCFHFLAQHCDKTREFSRGLNYIDQALGFHPDCVELHATKAKLLKHAGQLTEAASSLAIAHALDPVDRWVGSKCARYLLRAGQIEPAISIMAKYTKAGEEVISYLCETQCCWFFLELGEAYLAQGARGDGLASLLQVMDIFQEMERDQLDFHLFALNKMRLCAYVDLLKEEESMRSNKHFIRAAHRIVQTFVAMHDEREANGSSRPTKPKKTMPADSKAKTTAKKRLREATMLEQTEAPLEEARIYLHRLLKIGSNDIQTLKVAFDLHLKRRKLLLALKSLLRMEAARGSVDTLQSCTRRLLSAIEDQKTAPDDRVRIVIETLLQQQAKPNLIDTLLQQQAKPNLIGTLLQQQAKPNLIETLQQQQAKPNLAESNSS